MESGCTQAGTAVLPWQVVLHNTEKPSTGHPPDPAPCLPGPAGGDPPRREGLDTVLRTPAKTFAVTRHTSPVFHEGLGQLVPVRAGLDRYPHGLWPYLIAGQWQRISLKEAFVGRCGEVGDELGSGSE